MPVEVATVPQFSLHPFLVPLGPLAGFLPWALSFMERDRGAGKAEPTADVPSCSLQHPRALPTRLVCSPFSDCPHGLASQSPIFLISCVTDRALQGSHKHLMRLRMKAPGTGVPASTGPCCVHTLLLPPPWELDLPPEASFCSQGESLREVQGESHGHTGSVTPPAFSSQCLLLGEGVSVGHGQHYVQWPMHC